MSSRTLSLSLLAVLALGCTRGAEAPARAPQPVDHDDASNQKPSPHGHRRPVPEDVVIRAELPFHGVRVEDDTPLEAEQLLDELARADVVCVGEEHDNPHSHWAELRILQGLIERRSMTGRQLGVGLEMVETTKQEVLDRFVRGEIEADELESELDWKASWGWAYAYYRPQLELARDRGVQLVALNVPRELPRAVSRKGVDSLDPQQHKRLPELDLADHAHREWFKKQMHGHPSPHASADNMYAAQVVWDEGMATAAAKWLGDEIPGKQLVIFAGGGHCWSRAIPKRLSRRTHARIATVRPITLPAAEHPLPKLEETFDYLFVMSPE